MSSEASPSPAPELRRALGPWDLTAIGVNLVIGAAIFLAPSEIASYLGNWSPIAFVAAGIASLLVALCFAEVGSRFDTTGGPYLYTRAAFGDFVGFEVGWMQWFTRVSSWASVANGLTLALGYYQPALKTGAGRVLTITGLTLALAVINVRGIRPASGVVNALAIGKLTPLAVLLVIGLPFADWHRLAPLAPLTMSHAASGGLLLIFTFGGFDVISVPAGEARDPRRDVPFAFLMTIAIVTLVMTLLQVVAMTTLADVTKSATPLADAALRIMGPLGAGMIGMGAVISMTGNNAGQVLTSSRLLFAFAENGALPRWFGRIHPVYRTPSNAIWFTSAVALALALTGSFQVLAAASAVARLVTYTGVSTATLALRRPTFQGRVRPATFATPLGAAIPALATLVSLTILAGASRMQWLVGGAALAAGGILWALAGRSTGNHPRWPSRSLSE